ncbi:MAG: cytochrome c-type biogenesis CcmF C-terminal domain-containing protein, partial [Parvibaculum sp.]
LYVAAAVSLMLGLGFWYAQNGGPVMAVAGLALAFFVMGGAVSDLWYRAGFGKHPLSTAWSRLKGLPRSAFGTSLAHFGMGVTVLGVVAVTTFETETVVEMKPGMTVEAGGYVITFDGIRAA